MKKRILAAFLALVMVISGIYFTKPEAEEVKAATTQANTEVPTEMLGIKVQPRVHDNGTPNDKSDDTMDLRVLSSVDSLDYKEVGFYVWYDSAAENPTESNRTTRFKTTTVFKRIGATSKVAYKFSPKIIDTCAEYFVTGTIMGIKYDNWGKDFYIQAYCVTNDGQTETGVGRYFNVKDATSKQIINIPIAMPAEEALVGDITTVTVGGKPTDASVEAYIDGYAHLNVQVADKTALPSASVIEHVIIPEGTDVQYLETGNKAIYRNLETDYKGTGTEDTSWYTVYEAEGETEFIIATDADLYGLSTLTSNFAGKTIYMVADIDANDGKGTAATTGFTRSDSKAPYAWNPIGTTKLNASNNFAGTFDGQMHTIEGIYLEKNYQTLNGAWGFFGYTGDCTIQNLTLDNSYMSMSTDLNNVQFGAIAGVSVGDFDTIKVAEDVYLKHTTKTKARTGGIVGYITTASDIAISNCWFAGEMIAAKNMGGIVGEMNTINNIRLEGCLNSGDIIVNENAVGVIGGLCGYVMKSKISFDNCMVTGTLGKVDDSYTYSGTVGSVAGYVEGVYTGESYGATLNSTYTLVYNTWNNYSVSGSNLYVDGTIIKGTVSTAVLDKFFVTEANCTGAKGYGYLNLDFTIGDDYTGYWSVAEDGTPVLSSFVKAEDMLALDEITTPRKVWYTKADTAATEYQVASKADMYGLASLTDVDFAGKTIKLMADVTMNEGEATSTGFAPEEGAQLISWTPKAMAGTFDGCGHTLEGVYVSESTGNVGLFATVSGTVKNLKLRNSYFQYTGNKFTYWDRKFTAPLGSVAGVLSGTLDTVYSDATVVHSGAYAGGLVGIIKDAGTVNTITNSCYAGNITANSGVGGILGCLADTSATITHCLNTGTITAGEMAGGLCGVVVETVATDVNPNLTLTDCLNVGAYKKSISGNVSYNCSGIGCIWNPTKAGNVYVDATNTYVLETITSEENGVLRWRGFAQTLQTGNVVTNGGETVSNVLAYGFKPIQSIIAKTSLNLSFLPEGQASSATDNYYWVAREGKIPMLESFEDLLTNLEF